MRNRLGIWNLATAIGLLPTACGSVAKDVPSLHTEDTQVMEPTADAADDAPSLAASPTAVVEDETLADGETPGLPHFSFFVTSMGGLQELSGNQYGFGGDLRFGETGPGTGLRETDKICCH